MQEGSCEDTAEEKEPLSQPGLLGPRPAAPRTVTDTPLLLGAAAVGVLL